MSTRSIREGVSKYAYNFHKNKDLWAQQVKVGVDARGWHQPVTVWERFESLNMATHYFRRAVIFSGASERSGVYFRPDFDKGSVRFYLLKARMAPRPRLP